ncbi:hypothetical protein C1645_824462 [Glomus cerebriforme]|uniref:Uncharacterized protein n=1 Tax=Glomus cerebriforme TaxID=658196 RepID=A0A397T0W2_9GLOM|nr:hypothetical protein C1645_824462 [Glomus cerebriforme]
MTSNTNISSDKSEAQLYKILFYKKKDIIAIQKKLGKTLEDSFGLLFDLVGELIDIQEDLDVAGHPILTILYENIQDLEEETFFGKMSLGTLYYLLLYLEENISAIQNHLGIISHSDQKISGLEEANKNARVYLQNF